MTENKKKKKVTFAKILKKVKIRHFVILFLLLVANSYAWLIYVNTVNNTVDVHVASWKIDFKDGDDQIVDYVNVVVDNIYPGMPNFTNELKAFNYSEVMANVSYSILEANIMGDEYVTIEGRAEKGEQSVTGDLTSDQLKTRLLNEYPFQISFNISSQSMEAETGLALFTTNVTWAYESGNDELDTQWGTRAYNFRQDNPTDPCITLKVKVYITQSNS